MLLRQADKTAAGLLWLYLMLPAVLARRPHDYLQTATFTQVWEELGPVAMIAVPHHTRRCHTLMTSNQSSCSFPAATTSQARIIQAQQQCCSLTSMLWVSLMLADSTVSCAAAVLAAEARDEVGARP